ncbi:MAG: acyloxyacyl hydrolase [Hyphomicrobiales bacterium]|nr:acyloxyacyl hydrolase [Hyphomicrobiales bacterium]
MAGWAAIHRHRHRHGGDLFQRPHALSGAGDFASRCKILTAAEDFGAAAPTRLTDATQQASIHALRDDEALMIAVGSHSKFLLAVSFKALALAALIASPATAGFLDNFEKTAPFPTIDEVRFGLLLHDAEESNSEDGVDLNAEVLFGRVGHERGNFLDHFLMPRPHLGATVSFSGDTSMGYFGFTWDTKLTDRIFVETSFGGALHDGPHDDKDDAAFGCAFNFRESASLGVALSEQWRILLTVDHMSNAGLCGENDGLTNAGVRLGYKW